MEQQQDLLQDFELDAYQERASTGLRFANGLLDGILIRIINNIPTFFAAIFGTSITAGFFYGMDRWAIYAVSYFFSLLLSFAYYTISEGSTKGLTIGKLATSTRAVMNDGSFITWQTAALRSLCRLVPFEALSALGGYPWHDRWTNTQVVKVRK